MYKTHMYMYIFENMLKFLLIEVSVKEQNDGFRHNWCSAEEKARHRLSNFSYKDTDCLTCQVMCPDLQSWGPSAELLTPSLVFLPLLCASDT